MKYLSLSLLCFLMITQTGLSQNLVRKGSLGVGFYQKVPDSLLTKLQYQKGALIRFIVPNTTAASLGVQPNDIITQINNKTIDAPNELFPIAKNLRDGEKITISIIRNQNPITLEGKVVARPKETSATADVVYGEFAYKNGYVRTIYKTLKGKKPIGTVYFLQGLACYSMDNFQELDKTKQALDAMVDRGFAVYRMEKADMGDNIGIAPCETMGYHEELAMYEAGYKHLLTLKEVDKSSIFLFGHSMGGITAPVLAEKFQPRGIVVYGTGFKPWLEYLCDAYLIQLQLRGEDLGALRADLEIFKPYLYDYFYKDKPIDEICQDPVGLRAMQEILGYNPITKITSSTRSPLTYKELNQHNVAKALSNYQNDVLAIYGECDIAANNADDHINLIKYVNSKRPGNGTFWLAPKTTHGFEEIGTMEEFIKWQNNPQAFQQYAATRFNSKVFDYTCDWMKEVLKKTPSKRMEPLFREASENLMDNGAKGASMDVKAIDIDGDKDLDIVLANEFQANTILINNGKGVFTNESAQRLPQVVHDSEDVVVADFNGDKLLDIIFCSEDDKIHEYYINTGKGVFKEADFKLPNSEANAVITADLNKDGKPDLIFGNNGVNTILINNGKGAFNQENNRLPQITRVTQDLVLLDVDKDGDLDLFVGCEDGNLLYLNNGKGFFTDVTETNLPKGVDMETRKVSVTDVDKDGDLDLFLSNVNFRGDKNPQNRLYINNGKGKFTDETDSRLPTDTDHTIDAVFEDINNDGSLDIVVSNVFGGYLKIYLNNGKGKFADETDAILGKKYVRDGLGVIVADLDGDGQKDIYVCDRHNPAIDKKDLLLLKNKKIIESSNNK